MNMRWLPLLSLLAAVLLLPVAAAAADAVPIGSLLAHAPAFDGQSVTIEGEALGDVMRRGDGGWVNIGDGSGVIGIWASTASLDTIQQTGVHGRIGDRVRVTGTFYRAAANLGGDTAVVADTLAVVAPGQEQPRPVSLLRVLLALVLAGLAAALVVTWRRRPVH